MIISASQEVGQCEVGGKRAGARVFVFPRNAERWKEVPCARDDSDGLVIR